MLKVENFKKLVEAWRDDEDVLELIENNMNSFAKYVESVYTMEYRIKMARIRFAGEGEKIRDITMNLDRQRRICHEAAIRSVAQLCRWATMKGVNPIFDGDLEDRYQIADFCRAIVLHFFDSGVTGTTVDHSFPHKNIDELMATPDHLEED